jgi:hypothetical protein
MRFHLVYAQLGICRGFIAQLRWDSPSGEAEAGGQIQAVPHQSPNGGATRGTELPKPDAAAIAFCDTVKTV